MIKKEIVERILENIPSKDLKRYLVEKGWLPTDKDMATLVCNIGLPVSEQFRILRRIQDGTEDITLKQMIDAEVREQEEILYRFSQFDRHQIYVIHWKIRDGRTDFGGVFDRPETAEEYAMQETRRMKESGYSETESKDTDIIGYRIGKHEIIRACNITDADETPCAWLDYGMDGEVYSCWDNVQDQGPMDSERLSERYISIPHPFRTGDRVRIVGTESYGTVYYDPEAQEAIEKRYYNGEIRLDWFDVCLTVNYGVDKKGFIDHDHINPMHIEYTDDISKPKYHLGKMDRMTKASKTSVSNSGGKAKFLATAGKIDIDENAVSHLREVSMI